MPRGKEEGKRLESGLDAVDERNVLRAMLRSACFTKCCSISLSEPLHHKFLKRDYIENINQLKWFGNYVLYL